MGQDSPKISRFAETKAKTLIHCTLIGIKEFKMSKWKNVPGQFNIELEYQPEIGVFDLDGKHLPMLTPYLKGDGELVIHWLSSGYYDSGSMYGGPDNLGWPPEGDEERTLSNAYIHADSTIDLPKDVQQELFDVYEKKIMDQACPEDD
jgi:hypothetical protein